MAFNERIRLAIDVVTGDATGPLRKLSTDLKEADGAFAKAKVGASGFVDILKNNLGSVALGASAALATFAAKAVGDFQRTALGAGQLRDKLGVTAEEASRLQETAGDLGIGLGAVESSIGRMNRTAAQTPGVFKEIGAEIVRNSDGTINVTETFLSVVDALNEIPDAAERAAAAQKIFGRGWQEIAELVAMGADEVRAAMESVEGGKIIDDAEVARAREFRDTMDELRGTWESIAADAGGAIVTVVNAIGSAKEAVDGFENRLESGMGAGVGASLAEDFDLVAAKAVIAGNAYQDSAGSAENMAAAAEQVSPALEDNAAAAEDEAKAMQESADAAKASADAHQAEADALLESVAARRSAADSQFALNDAQRDFADTIAGYNELLKDSDTTMQDLAAAQDDAAKSAGAVADAALRVAQDQAAANGATLSAAAAGDVWRSSMLQQAAAADGPLRDAILAYVSSVEEIPPEKMTEIQAAIARGDLATAQRLLDEASETRTAEIEADANVVQSERELEDHRRKKRVAEILAAANTQAAEEGLTGTARRRRVADILAQALTSGANSDLGFTARQRSAIVSAVAHTGSAEAALNSVARDRSATIRVTTMNRVYAVAEGGIFQGGVQSFANGGHRLPRHATIQPPVGPAGLFQWAEPETGGEGFVPLAPSKRTRSLQIMRQLAGMMNHRLVPMANGGISIGGDGVSWAGPRTVNYQTINMPAGVGPSDAKAALRRWEQRNGAQ